MIKVFSKEEISEFYKNNPYDVTPVISITDIEDTSPVPATHPMCLRLSFDDVTEYHVSRRLVHPYYRQQFLHRPPVFFSVGDAMSVMEFLNKASQSLSNDTLVPKLYIHCYKGMSRSIAIAIYAELFTVFGDGSFFLTEKYKNSICNSDVLKNMIITHYKIKGVKNEI